MKHFITLITFLLLFSCGEKGEEKPQDSSLSSHTGAAIYMQYRDLDLFKRESVRAILVCEKEIEPVEGNVTLDEGAQVAKISFVPGDQPIVGKICKIAVQGLPNNPEDIIYVADQEVAGLIYISSNFVVEPGTSEEGRLISRIKVVMYKTYMKVKTRQPDDSAPVVVTDPEASKENSREATETDEEVS